MPFIDIETQILLEGARGAQAGGARGEAGGARGEAGGARAQAGGARAQAGGARGEAGGARAQAGGARGEAGGARAQAGGARGEAGGARGEAGGARGEAGGARAQAGGARAQAEGARAQAEGARGAPEQRIEICPAFMHGGCNRRGPCRKNLAHVTRKQIDTDPSFPLCQECCTVDFCPANRTCDECTERKQTAEANMNQLIADRNHAIDNIRHLQARAVNAYELVRQCVREHTSCGTSATLEAKIIAQKNYANIYEQMHVWQAQDKDLTRRRYECENLRQPRCTHNSCNCDTCKYGNCPNKEACFRSHAKDRRQDKLAEKERLELQRTHVICTNFAESGRCTNPRCNYSHLNLCEKFRVTGSCNDANCMRDHKMSPEEAPAPAVERMDTPCTLEVLGDQYEAITEEFKANEAKWKEAHPERKPKVVPVVPVAPKTTVNGDDEDDWEFDEDENVPRAFRMKWKPRYGYLPLYLPKNTSPPPPPSSHSQSPKSTRQSPTKRQIRRAQENSSPDHWSGLIEHQFSISDEDMDTWLEFYLKYTPRVKPGEANVYNFISITTIKREEM